MELMELKENIVFLKELQKELITQDNDGNASPVFWVIRDYRWVSAPNEEGDRISAFIPSRGDSYELYEYIEGILEDLENDSLDYDLSDGVIQDLRDHIEFDGDYAVQSWINEHLDYEIRFYYENHEPYIVPDTFFITKSEAKKYIEMNKHNLTSKAHTYAMTALRSPVVERLWNVLENFDWDSIDKVNDNEMPLVGVSVGKSFQIIDESLVNHINLKESNTLVVMNNVNYNLLIGTTFEDSQEVDKILDQYGELKISDYIRK